MSGPGAGPQWSQDGKFWWDGERWQPAPQSEKRMPGQTLPTPVLMLLVGVMTVVVFLLVVAIALGG